MTSLAVTGHMDLTEDSVPLIREALDGLLERYADSGLVGVSCIAQGADSLFAERVLAAGGRLVVVIPSQDYRRTTVPAGHAETFDRLLAAADEVRVMPSPTANRQAYEAANTVLLRRAERLVAVWDGQPPTGKGGGTADVVLQAEEAGIPVDVIWPAGAARCG
ncbi:hypothetical protein [Streptomyces bluensis]|uniref:DNA recombination-mediator protein A n=1 Tax=Streptomyces bluensis TaxID=33897 RepID=A0ABW6UFZ3_9ACTN